MRARAARPSAASGRRSPPPRATRPSCRPSHRGFGARRGHRRGEARCRRGRRDGRPGSPGRDRHVAPRRGSRRGSPSKAIAPEFMAMTRSAAARQRSRRCSARRIVTPHSSFSRRSSQISSSPATGSSCEVGSSSRTRRGAGDEGRCQRHSLELAAGEGVYGAVEEVRDGEGEGHLLDRAGAGGGRVAAHLQGQLDLGGDRGRDDLGLGVLGDVADDARQLARARLDRVEAGDLDGPVDLAAVEVRDEAAGGAQQGRLAAGRAPGEHDELPRRRVAARRRAAPPRRRICG